MSALAVSALLGLIIPFIDLPIPERDDIVEVPERFAKLIERAVQIPLPRQPVPVEPEEFSPPEPEEVVPHKPVETKPKVAEVAEPAIAKQESAREKVASKGILAFRDSFAVGLMQVWLRSQDIDFQVRVDNGQIACHTRQGHLPQRSATPSQPPAGLAACLEPSKEKKRI